MKKLELEGRLQELIMLFVQMEDAVDILLSDVNVVLVVHGKSFR